MGCPHIPELAYGEFSKSIHEKISGQSIPISGSFEITFHCNLRCKHCYAAYGQSGIPGQEELTLPEIKRIIDELVDEGCLWLLLTGGDPLVRRDFMDIYTYAKRKGLILTLFTNGTLLTPRIADYLAEWQPFSVEITLYGYTQETYERVTGIPGSHYRCMRGIEYLMGRGIPLRLKSMLLTLNKHELAEMKAFSERLGVEFRYDPLVSPGLQKEKFPLQFRISPEEVLQMEQADEDRSKRWSQLCNRFVGTTQADHKLYLCLAGKNSFHIDPYGRLSLCTLARVPYFDLREKHFHQGWESMSNYVLNAEYSEDYECRDCQIRFLCSQCPAFAILETGDPQKRVDYICQLSHLRARAFSPKEIELNYEY
jgi:radical SAM protein with 4Fe4S-binding SPASM domain